MTIAAVFFKEAKKSGRNKALLYKAQGDDSWSHITWDDFASRVRILAEHLIESGLKKGDRVALLSENRPEWAISDLAILAAGCITVPVYFTNTTHQIDHILKDSGADRIIVSSKDQLDKLLKSELIGDIREIILIDRIVPPFSEKVTLLEDILKRTEGEAKGLIEERLSNVSENDTASILYTSGTTGLPKGVMLTHKNLLSNALSSAEVIKVSENDTLLSFLPLSHAFERTAGYYAPMLSGAKIAYAESIEKIPRNMREVSPTIMLGVPRFYEKTYSAIMDVVQGGPSWKKAIFRWAIETGSCCSEAKSNGSSTSLWLAIKEKLAEFLVLRRLKDGMGGRLRFFVSGGAPLSKEIADFFNAAGLVILEGYGLTESSPVITCNRPGRRKAGTVGIPLPGVEIKIAGDGEILTKGPHVMKGYYNNPEATEEIISEGWLHTGDIGIIDSEGYLTITDRIKDIIVTSGGKNVAPQAIETDLIADPLIHQVMVYGDRRKYLTALIVPDFERLRAEIDNLEETSLAAEELIEKREVIDLYTARLEERLADFAPYERIKRFSIISEEFSMAKGEITPTLKVNRKKLTERYGHLLDGLYDDE